MKSLSDDQQTQNQPQCLKCKHYMHNTSCGACVSHGIEQVKKIINTETIESSADAKENSNGIKKIDLDSYRYACQVVMNSPGDFDVVNPYNCKYYFPNALKLY